MGITAGPGTSRRGVRGEADAPAGGRAVVTGVNGRCVAAMVNGRPLAEQPKVASAYEYQRTE